MEFSIGVSSRFVCFFNVGNSCALAPFSRYSKSYIPLISREHITRRSCNKCINCATMGMGIVLDRILPQCTGRGGQPCMITTQVPNIISK